MLGEVGTDFGEIGLARGGIGPARLVEREEVLGRTGEERRQRQRHDVGGRAVGQVDLHGHTPAVSGCIGRSGVAAAVGEAHVGAPRVTGEVRCPAQRCRVRRRRERRRAQHALRVCSPMPGMPAVGGVEPVDQPLRDVVRHHGSVGRAGNNAEENGPVSDSAALTAAPQ